MITKTSPDNQAVTRILTASFGDSSSVDAYGDVGERSTLDIFSRAETPERGLTSFSTIGLSDHPIPGLLQPPLGVELVGTSNHAEFANVLATAGFSVINEGWIAEPYNVFVDVVSEHFDDVTTPHLFLVSPYLWEGLESRRLTTKTVAFLHAIPITEAERDYHSRHGGEALDDALEKGDPNIVDLWRASTT